LAGEHDELCHGGRIYVVESSAGNEGGLVFRRNRKESRLSAVARRLPPRERREQESTVESERTFSAEGGKGERVKTQCVRLNQMLAADRVQFERYYQPVFEPVSFAVGPGGLLLVTGPNGSGKTTLIRLLAGLLQPDAGSIRIDAAKTAYIGHQLAVKEDLTVWENLRFTQRFAGGSCLPEEALFRLGLGRARDQEARSLSAGQRKRCALARLLMVEAGLWLLDEPYSNLDHDGVAIVDSLLAQHLQDGGACVMSTHGALRPKGIDYRECELSVPEAGQ
jgi:heme exporter protein A